MKQEDVFTVAISADDHANVITSTVFQSDVGAEITLPVFGFYGATKYCKIRSLRMRGVLVYFLHWNRDDLSRREQTLRRLDRFREVLMVSSFYRYSLGLWFVGKIRKQEPFLVVGVTAARGSSADRSPNLSGKIEVDLRLCELQVSADRPPVVR